jgi:fluoroquinolone resistance protein
MEDVGSCWLGALDLQLSQQQGQYSLWGETFGGFSIEDADLSEGDFDHAGFEDIVFKNCDLSTASFDKATFDKVIFMGCNISGSSLLSAELIEVSFLDCQMDGIALDDAQIAGFTVDTCKGQVSFDNAAIKDSVISNCNFSRSTFLGTELVNVDFTESNMSRAEFDKTSTFLDCAFNECDITQMRFSTSLGAPDVILHKCTYLPFLRNIALRKTPLALPPVGGTSKMNNTRFNVYGNWGNDSAYIYCSSLEEYRSI